MKALQRILMSFFIICFVIAQPNKIYAAELDSIQHAINELNQFHHLQIQAGIQDSDLSYEMRRALILADLLFDANDQFQAHLCKMVKPYFVSSQPKEAERNIDRLLDVLDNSWQTFFDKISKPQDPKSVAHLALRALFSLGPQDVVTNRHAKVAVLAALFAPVNQGPVGNCFAIADLIRDHNNYFLQSARDYADIVQKGFITRLVNTHDDYFFFLPILADTDQNQPFTIDKSGYIGAHIFLFEAPGFAAASHLMGGDQIPHLSNQVIQLLFQGHSTDHLQVTASQVIKAMADIITSTHSQLNKDDLIRQGLYGFSSLTNQPILRGTECAFASMAEDRPRDSTRSNINDCLATVMASIWQSLGSAGSDFQKAFNEIFNASYRLVYNLDIPLPQVSADGSSTNRGFQLYQRIPNQPTLIGILKITPEDFRELVLAAIILTKDLLGTSPSVVNIANLLIQFVQSDTFLREILWAYDILNQQEPDPVAHYMTLPRTPMQSCDGDNPYEVNDIDTGHSFESNVQTITVANPQALINWCLNLSKKTTLEFCPMNSPQHAFNFVPTIPDLVAYKKSGLSPTQWIQKMLIIPGMKIATQQIDANTKLAFAKACLNALLDIFTDLSAINKLITSLNNNQSLTIQNYAQNLLSGICSLLNLNSTQANQLALLLDDLLVQVLPQNEKTIIQQSAIRFAFTNWNIGNKNIYFCAYFNLRTAQIGFGSIAEDKTNLQPMDETAWVNNQQWDVDLISFAPSLIAMGM